MAQKTKKPLTDKTVIYDPKAYNCDAKHIYEMTVKALKESGCEDKVEEYERFISYGDHRHLIQVSKQYVKLVRMETKTPPRRRSGGEHRGTPARERRRKGNSRSRFRFG